MLVGGVNRLEIGGDLFPRLGPERRAVGEVRRPKNIIHADIVAMSDAEAVVDESGVELAAKIFARFEL